MFEPKSAAASLTADLLVRKGQARPALNPGLVLETEDGARPPRRVIALPRPESSPHAARQEAPTHVAKPVVEDKSAPRRRVAFTYRLDPERHLNLRVVAIYKRTSAQKILDEALDRYLEEVMAAEGSLVFTPPLAASA